MIIACECGQVNASLKLSWDIATLTKEVTAEEHEVCVDKFVATAQVCCYCGHCCLLFQDRGMKLHGLTSYILP
jgi:hypothetical protein